MFALMIANWEAAEAAATVDVVFDCCTWKVVSKLSWLNRWARKY